MIVSAIPLIIGLAWRCLGRESFTQLTQICPSLENQKIMKGERAMAAGFVNNIRSHED